MATPLVRSGLSAARTTRLSARILTRAQSTTSTASPSSDPTTDPSWASLTDAQRSMRLKMQLVHESSLMHVPVAGAKKAGPAGPRPKPPARKEKEGEKKPKYTFHNEYAAAGAGGESEGVIPRSPRGSRAPRAQDGAQAARQPRAAGSQGPRQARAGGDRADGQRNGGSSQRRQQGEQSDGVQGRANDHPARRNDRAPSQARSNGSDSSDRPPRRRDDRDRSDRPARPPRMTTAELTQAHLSAAEADWTAANRDQQSARKGLEELFGQGGLDVVGETEVGEVKGAGRSKARKVSQTPIKAGSADYSAFLPPSPLRVALSGAKAKPAATAVNMLDWTLARNGSVSRQQRATALGMVQQRLGA